MRATVGCAREGACVRPSAAAVSWKAPLAEELPAHLGTSRVLKAGSWEHPAHLGLISS